MKRPPTARAAPRPVRAAARGATAGLKERRLGKSKTAVAANGTIKLGILANFIGFHLRQAQDAAFRAFSSYPGLKNFKPGRFAVMMVIHYNHGITQGTLGRAIARDKSTVTPILQDLQRHGLIERRRPPHDRRTIRLSLTRRGEQALSELLVHVHAHDRRLDAIAGEAKPVLLDLLRKITDALR